MFHPPQSCARAAVHEGFRHAILAADDVAPCLVIVYDGGAEHLACLREVAESADAALL